MRKYVIGAIIGFCLSLGAGAHAEVSNFVGKVIEGAFPVTYNTKSIGDGLVIDGTTYLPVRKISDALGLTVSFDADLGVSLTKPVTGTTYAPPQEVKPVVTTSANKVITVEEINNQINTKKADIWSVNAWIASHTEVSAGYAEIINRLAKYETELSDLEKQKAELNK